MQTSPALRACDSPLPHTLRPGALGRLRKSDSGPSLARGPQRPPCAKRSDRTSTKPTAHSHSASASAVYVRIPSTMEHHREIPGLLVHDQKHAGRSEYAEHLGKGGGYIRPRSRPVSKASDEIEGRIGIGQPGNIPLPHFAAPGGDGSGVLPEAGGDALSGKIDPADRPLRAEFQKLRQIRPAAASYIEHPGVWLRRHMRPTPLRQRSVSPVHSPQHDPPG